MHNLKELRPPSHLKRSKSDSDIQNPSCIICKNFKTNNFFSLCFCCEGHLCPTCQNIVEINGKNLELCETCLELTLNSSIYLRYEQNSQQDSEKFRKIHEEIKEIKRKNAENLAVLRELNLSFIQLSQETLAAESEMELRLVKIHENFSEIGAESAMLTKEKNRLLEEVDMINDNLESLEATLNTTEKLITKDSGKILDIEKLILEQRQENLSLLSTLGKIKSQNIQELEICDSTKTLKTHLQTFKLQLDEAKTQARNENYKKMLEQFKAQEIQLKELKLHLKDSPITDSKCKCHIM